MMEYDGSMMVGGHQDHQGWLKWWASKRQDEGWPIDTRWSLTVILGYKIACQKSFESYDGE